MKCVVSDYSIGMVRILDIGQDGRKMQCEEIEAILINDYGFRLKDIEWIMVELDKIFFE